MILFMIICRFYTVLIANFALLDSAIYDFLCDGMPKSLVTVEVDSYLLALYKFYLYIFNIYKIYIYIRFYYLRKYAYKRTTLESKEVYSQ